MPEQRLTRRSFLIGAAAVAAGLVGCSSPSTTRSARRPPTPTTPPITPTTSAVASSPAPEACATPEAIDASAPLWKTGLQRGLIYGSSTATWQISDREYAELYAREAAIMFTEDDLLWYRLKPRPEADLDFRFGDRVIGFAEDNGMLVFGTHLVWDEGFGNGWRQGDLFGLSRTDARELLFGTLRATVERYRGRVQFWSVVNEAIDGSGLRADYPWFQTIGPSYIAESFRLAHEADPDAVLVLNQFGYEEDDGFAPPEDMRAQTLRLLDRLLADGVPVHALGIQAHLNTWTFDLGFEEEPYRRFLREVADRGLRILVTEMDVLDDGEPPDPCVRDKAVAHVYRRYLDVALDEPAVVSLMTFGLSDRYTWLEEDFPRDDGKPRRPLMFDDELEPKPAFVAVENALRRAPKRKLFVRPPRAS